MTRHSNVPTEQEGSNGVKTKWLRGDTTDNGTSGFKFKAYEEENILVE
jgi:hypothetical protein